MQWVNEECVIVFDRFLYHGHICYFVWDPITYPLCDEHATWSAEAMNHVCNSPNPFLDF